MTHGKSNYQQLKVILKDSYCSKKEKEKEKLLPGDTSDKLRREVKDFEHNVGSQNFCYAWDISIYADPTLWYYTYLNPIGWAFNSGFSSLKIYYWT